MSLGIGVAIAAAAAIAVLAMQTQSAAESQKTYNEELTKGLAIERRRQANQRLVRRGEYEEVID
jgi:type II secretory pathway pseudopilin PulG